MSEQLLESTFARLMNTQGGTLVRWNNQGDTVGIFHTLTFFRSPFSIYHRVLGPTFVHY